jgi:hypothetical protein
MLDVKKLILYLGPHLLVSVCRINVTFFGTNNRKGKRGYEKRKSMRYIEMHYLFQNA